MDNIFFHSKEFEEFDQFVESLRAWDIEIYQLEKGRFTSSFQQLSTGDTLISTAQFGGHTHQIGSPPPKRTFALLAAQDAPFTWRKHTIEPDSLMIFPTGGDLDAVTGPGTTKVITISTTDEQLAESLTEHEAEILSHHLSKSEIVTLPQGQLQAVDNFCQKCFEKISHKPQLVYSREFQQTVTENLLTELTRLVCSTSSRYKMAIKEDSWRTIDALLYQSDIIPTTVRDFCHHAQVSERTLLRYFHKRFGVSPKTYINRLRLNKVKSELNRTKHRKGIIANVANKWGFWHMGQFAHDYRQLFGKLPSETLHNNTHRLS